MSSDSILLVGVRKPNEDELAAYHKLQAAHKRARLEQYEKLKQEFENG